MPFAESLRDPPKKVECRRLLPAGFSFATNASLPPLKVGSNAPAVVGKSDAPALPTTKAAPDASTGTNAAELEALGISAGVVAMPRADPTAGSLSRLTGVETSGASMKLAGSLMAHAEETA